MTELIPTPEEVGLRADAWIASGFPKVRKADIRKFLDAGMLTLAPSGRKVSKGDKIIDGGIYWLKQLPQAEELRANEAVTYTVLAEDNGILAVSKPAGTDCLPNEASETDTLANGLLARWPQLAGVGNSPLTCGVLHRIDRATSGLVLVALTQEVYGAVRGQFSEHTVVKRYLALVQGSLMQPGRLVNELAHNPRYPGHMIDATKWNNIRRPMHAETDYEPIRRYRLEGRTFTLVDVTIRTGVTHQIRAQFSFAGMPLLGDSRYGGLQLPDFPRHFLHSTSAELLHPITEASVRYEAPLTDDLTVMLNRMTPVRA